MATYAVIGAGPGVSYETARRFGKEGFELVLMSRSEDKLKELVNQLNEEGFKASYQVADANDSGTIKKAITSLSEIDVLHYNASVLVEADLLTVEAEQLEKEYRIDVLGIIEAVQGAMPKLKKSSNAAVLLTGGGLALNPSAGLPGLSLGKSAMRSLGFMLHDRLKKEGVFAGMITINGMVERGTALDPENAAEALFSLYQNQDQVEIKLESDK
ncbi:SDR family NAD(P)-dependent oxidoreductase [Jeotgalibacillus aurantiacus]|uniref:SDR family NAD(P)-dependent oxidoreductase n=1 Tax=Jeotgalibacillus aurantiacus TaxID=2763266 RepID=UPI001D0A2739|nr:SDR family NAD(P)-dependent oxidoreductase [Jeotgalibacillus aurantiacus]